MEVPKRPRVKVGTGNLEVVVIAFATSLWYIVIVADKID
jgi:hypothetical protein